MTESSSSPPQNDELLRALELVALLHVRGTDRDRASVAERHIAQGASPAAGLRIAGLDERLASFLEAAPPHDVASSLANTARALAARDHAVFARRLAAWHGLSAALPAIGLAAIARWVVLPAVDVMRQASSVVSPTDVAWMSVLTLVAFATSATASGLLVAVARGAAIPATGGEVIAAHDRATVLTGVSALTAVGINVIAALRASARLTPGSPVAVAALTAADAFEKGAPVPEAALTTLLPAHGASLVNGALAHNVGAVVVPALADDAVVSAARASSHGLPFVRFACLLVAGIAVLVSALAVMLSYAGTQAGAL